ncbi:hypothetical protein INR49_009535 [Caranx melampygus]|nr:hypothetical protein INR49_009535 [Caranx melampygus]
MSSIRLHSSLAPSSGHVEFICQHLKSMALNGKVAVVTGAAMGIGRGLTEVLLQNGAKVALLDMNEAAAESLMETLNKEYGQGRALFLKCDVESEEQMKAAFQKTTEAFGGMDVLCNNAGILNEGAWEKTVAINLVRSRKNNILHLFISTITSKLGQFSNLVDATNQIVDKLGMLNVSEVAECILELLTDETKNVSHSDGTRFDGRAGEDITLPCQYDSKEYGNLSVCWRRGELPSRGACGDSWIISTDGKTENRDSSKYQLLGRLDEGDISMTIRNLTQADAGRYGCRVDIPGWFNDAKHQFDLTVAEAPQTTTSAPNTGRTTEKTERTTAGQSTGQMTSTESHLTSPSRTSSLEAKTSGLELVLPVCVLLGLVVLVTVVIIVVTKRRQLNKMPQQLHNSSTLQLQHRGSAVENIYQMDGGGDGGEVSQPSALRPPTPLCYVTGSLLWEKPDVLLCLFPLGIRTVWFSEVQPLRMKRDGKEGKREISLLKELPQFSFLFCFFRLKEKTEQEEEEEEEEEEDSGAQSSEPMDPSSFSVQAFPLNRGETLATGQPGPAMVPYTTVNISMERPPRDHVVWSLLSFLFFPPCCLGLAAVIYSFKARDSKMVGDFRRAHSYGSTACCINATATILFIILFSVFIYLCFHKPEWKLKITDAI